MELLANVLGCLEVVCHQFHALQGNNGRIDKTCPNQDVINYIKLTEN